MTVAAVLLAAGAGVRLGRGAPKAFLPLAGRPMFALSLEAMARSGVVDCVVLVVPGELSERAGELVAGLPLTAPVEAVVSGGDTRQRSVALGLEALPAGTDRVLCHDAARPFASPELFRRVVRALDRAEGAVPVVPSPDTVKRVRDGVVVETVPRSEVGLAQTPQGFAVWALRQAHRQAGSGGQTEATDDAALVERCGLRVVAVEGEPGNFKITTAEDYRRAELVLAGEDPGSRAAPGGRRSPGAAEDRRAQAVVDRGAGAGGEPG